MSRLVVTDVTPREGAEIMARIRRDFPDATIEFGPDVSDSDEDEVEGKRPCGDPFDLCLYVRPHLGPHKVANPKLAQVANQRLLGSRSKP